MRRALQAWLEARWYGAAPVPSWLGVLERLFGSAARRRRARTPPQRLPVPVIVVGNIAVGGSGKTPLVVALVQWLREAGWRPGVVSRGYGGRVGGAHRVEAGDDARRVGDEPLLIARRTGAPVMIGADRVAAARALIADGQVDVIVSDDGLQHYRLARDVEIAVVDGRRRFGNGRQLPAGPLREPVARLDEVDLVLVNGPRQPGEAGFDLVPGDAVPLTGGDARTVSSFVGAPLHAVAGIGDPQRFFDALRALGLTPMTHAFPDHHPFTAADLDFGDDAPVLMTEKDAVKCAAFARPHWYFVPVAAELPAAVVLMLGLRLGHPPPKR